MALISVNAVADKVLAAGPGPGDLVQQLRSATNGLKSNRPVVIMVHGYKFSPQTAACDPHQLIYAHNPNSHLARIISWPRALGFFEPEQATDPALAIGFGWHATGKPRQAFARALVAGQALARLIALLRAEGAGPVSILAHSMGARVALSALGASAAASIARMILLSGAEYGFAAQRAQQSSAGQSAEIINVKSRQNDLVDWFAERVLPRPAGAPPGDRLLGRGLSAAGTNWLDLSLDHPGTLAALGALGLQVAPPGRLISHWSTYLRAGAFGLYAELLRRPEAMPVALLREMQAGPPVSHRPFAHTPLHRHKRMPV